MVLPKERGDMMWFYVTYIVYLLLFALAVYKLYYKEYMANYNVAAIYGVACIGLQFAYSFANHSDRMMFMFLLSSIPAQIQFLFAMIYINIDSDRMLCSHIIMLSSLVSYLYLYIQDHALGIISIYILIAWAVSTIILYKKHEDWKKSRVVMNGFSLTLGSIMANMIVCCILDFAMPYADWLWSR